MNILKLRIYNYETGIMLYSYTPAQQEESREYYPFGFAIGYKGYKEGKLSKPMLALSITDKYSKDIYEGDFLEVDWHDGRYPVHTIGPVTYDAEYARWDIGEGGAAKHDAHYYMEIVGDIYRTPQLSLLTKKEENNS